MLFNSLEFLIFFPTVVLLYFAFPLRWRWMILLAASYYFYMAWKAEYVVLIIASTLVDYWASLKMGQIENQKKRKPWLWLSICSNLGILLTFKYFNFFSDNIQIFFNDFGINYQLPFSELILPMGISFYTFQTTAYSIDVYRGKIPPEKHLGYFALYVTYFPQLVAGPIERAQNLLHQFRQNFEFTYERAAAGLKQMLWGFFKKMVIADRVAVMVESAYGAPNDVEGLSLLLATYLFAFQIYCDFSGYSDIAIGASRIMGIKLMDNFKTPYYAKSISEFWKRWHISLSTWFRDYLYIPLGGNRVVKWRWYYNLLLVFVISGFWHGANWTFLIWGALHGIYLISAIVFKKFNQSFVHVTRLSMNPPFLKMLNIFLTFHLVLFAWIFFRANTIEDACLITNKILTLNFDFNQFRLYMSALGTITVLFWSMLIVVFYFTDPLIEKIIAGTKYLSGNIQLLLFSLIAALIVLLGSFGEVDFIYFQF